MIPNWQKYVALSVTGLILLMGGCLLFYHLGAEPFQDYDEATYADVVQEGQMHGNMLSFTLFGENYFRKPPLLFWLMDASEHVIPDVETAARFPSALAALLLIALTMLLVSEAGGSLFAVTVAGIMLATTSSFIEASRQVRFDSLVTLFNVGAVYAFLRGTRNRRWYLLVGVAFGLAVLAKGILAIFGGIALVALAISLRKFDWLRDPYFWSGIVLGLLIALPWHIYETLQFGVVFWHNYFETQVIDRVAQDLFGKGPSNLDYLSYLAAFAAPWAALWCVSVFASPYAYLRSSPRIRAVAIMSFVTVLAVFAVLFVTKTKAFTYLVPLYPFAAITVGLVAGSFWQIKNMIVRSLLIVTLILATLFGLWLSLINGTHTAPYYKNIVQHAREEYAAAKAMQAYESSASLYEFGENDIGSVQFYSGMHPVYLYSSETDVRSPIFIIFKPEDRALVQKLQPYRILTDIYTGTYVEVVSTGTD